MQRAIAHFDLDTFFVSVERLINPSLSKKPVLVGDTGSRGVVAACSYETRPFGIHSGMSMQVAKKLCPEASVVRGNSMNYVKYSDIITDILRESVPSFEKRSIDEFYTDLTGMDRFFGTYSFTKELRSRIIRETGLPISFGLSANKTVSKVATGEAKPNNQMRIDQGYEKTFLAPLHVRKIPMIGKKTAMTLSNMGVDRVGVLQKIPIEMLVSVLGKNGISLSQKANGIDNSPIVPYSERKSISSERTFNLDTIDLTKLNAVLTAMTEKLAYQLRMGDMLTGCIAVKLRYSDFSTHSKQYRIPYTSADHKILPVVLDLFKQLNSRRMLIRLVGVRFSHLVGGHYQISLFDDDQHTLNLYKSMDHIRNRFGPSSVMRASTIDVKSVRSNRNPFNGEPPVILAHRKQ